MAEPRRNLSTLAHLFTPSSPHPITPLLRRGYQQESSLNVRCRSGPLRAHAESPVTVLPGGATTTYQYNPLEELVEAENGSSELNFTYDGAGNLLTQTSCAPQAKGAACPANSAEPPSTL